MKLSEIMKNVLKTDENSEYVNVQDIARLFGLDLPSDHLPNEHITCYSFSRWMCTDTPVGGKIYFLNNVAVAVSWQQSRRDDEHFEFVGEHSVKQLRAYLVTLIDMEFEYIDHNQDMGTGYKINYAAELMDKQLILADTGELVNVISKHDCYVQVLKQNGETPMVPLENCLVPYKINYAA